MNIIRELLADVCIPPMYKVRCRYADKELASVPCAVTEALAASGMARRLRPGMSVAMAVGSRGLSSLPELVSATVAWFREQGARPFIVPAMGSHGGATAEGQRAVLANLGITEQSAGCPIQSSMDVVELGRTDDGQAVYMDALAAKADGIFVINRVKPHTSLAGPHQSGLVKMLVIGLGKQKGADACHAAGYARMASILPSMARLIINVVPALLGGLATVENAHDRVCRVEAVAAQDIMRRDAELLMLAQAEMPRLPLDELDILIVDAIGKNISGSGMDPNITGRYSSASKSGGPAITRIAVLGLTPETKGHATGMGNADAIPRAMWEQINFTYTYANAITSTLFRGASTPLVLENERQVIACMVKTCNAIGRPPTIIRIRDTLTLDRMLVSPAVAELLRERADCVMLSGPEEMHFGVTGELLDKTVWERFPEQGGAL